MKYLKLRKLIVISLLSLTALAGPESLLAVDGKMAS